MARTKVNKSASIRDAIQELGADTKPAAIVEHLAAKKIKVSPQAVSQVKIKAGQVKGKRGRKPSGNGLDLSALLAAKKLVDSLGIENARKAIDALAKLA